MEKAESVVFAPSLCDNNELYKYLSGKNSLLENENIVSDNKIE